MFTIKKEILAENKVNEKEKRTKSLKDLSDDIVNHIQTFPAQEPASGSLSFLGNYQAVGGFQMLTNLPANEIKILSHRLQGKIVAQIHRCKVLAIHSKVTHACM